MRWSKGLFIILVFVTSCSFISHDDHEKSILQLGLLLQNASVVDMYLNKKITPLAWNIRLRFMSKREMCLLQKQDKVNTIIKVVLYRDGDCSFALKDQILKIVFHKLQNLKINKKDNQLIFTPINYHFYLLSLEKKYKIYEANCGEKGEPACYRGKNYKKNVNTSCSTDNEAYFCADNLHVYCKHGYLECL